jgi:group I intron endonuclease
MVGIYKITNPKGRVYVGQSIDIEARWKWYHAGYCKQQVKLYNSLKKYRVENHIFEIVEECLEEQLNKRERYWQDRYNVLEEGLNCRLTSTEDKSGKISKETRKKISDTTRGKKLSEEHKKKLSEINKGRRHTEESRRKISDSKKNIPVETRKKISEAMKGRKLSKEHKEKISEINKGKKLSEETKKKIGRKGILNKRYGIASSTSWTSLNNPTRKILIHIATGQEFKSCTEAASYFKISKNTVTTKIKQGVFIVKQS